MNKNLYSDELISIDLNEKPFAQGSVVVSPISNKSYLSDLSDEQIERLFFGASYSASALFELIGAHGTNIFLTENKTKKLELNIIARKEGDGINMQWSPIQISSFEMDEIAKKIKDTIDISIWEKNNPEEAKKAKQVVEVKKEELPKEDEKKNFLFSIFNRKP